MSLLASPTQDAGVSLINRFFVTIIINIIIINGKQQQTTRQDGTLDTAAHHTLTTYQTDEMVLIGQTYEEAGQEGRRRPCRRRKKRPRPIACLSQFERETGERRRRRRRGRQTKGQRLD